jgi:hypothetical protein
MSVLGEFCAAGRYAKSHQDAILKFVFEHLVVAVNDELTTDEVEHDTSPRPFLIFGFMYDADQALRGTSNSPTFPELVVAVRACKEVSVFFGVG